MSNQKIENPFKSFWMAGFECTDQLNAFGNRVDFLHVTSHFELLQDDYQNLQAFNIKTVREGLRWSQVETTPGTYDFSTFQIMLEAGRKNGIQQIWDICHFGFPDDLSPVHPHFTGRFANLCRAFALFYKSLGYAEPLIVTPINEVSFMSWLGGDVAGTSPYCHNNGWEVKYSYMKAYIAGVEALKEVDPGIRIMTTEPLVNIVAKLDATIWETRDAKNHHELQYQSLDMLSGRMCPELGGKPEYLDILGFNYYYNNQWILTPHQILGWNDPVPHPYLRQLSDLLYEAHCRYNRPVVLAETSHPGVDRPIWIKYIATQISKTIQRGIPVWGTCIYPIIDRPNWDHLDDWHNSGLWDMDPAVSIKSRILHEPSAKALGEAMDLLSVDLQNAVNQQSFSIQHRDLALFEKLQHPEYNQTNLHVL